MIAWHKSYIHLRFDPNPMVFESLSGTFATSDFGLNRIRWYEKNLPGTNSTSDYVFSHIRWCAHSEMIKFNTSIYAFDQIRWYTCQKCSHSLHPITPSAISDGASAQKRSNSLHPFMLSQLHASDLAYAFFILLLVSCRTLPRTSEVCFCSISASALLAESMTDCGFAPTSISSPTRRSAWFRIR